MSQYRVTSVSCAADGSNADVALAIFNTAIGLVSPTFTPDGAFNVSSTLAKALAQTPQLLPATLASGFSQEIAGTIEFDTEIHNHSVGGGPTLPQTLAVAHACGQDAAITTGTMQVRLVHAYGGHHMHIHVNDAKLQTKHACSWRINIFCCRRVWTH